ncbi:MULTISPECIES: DUF6188 family protein [unclassified Rhizobacter]|uniref:DUF6188 family protein n=1 Tax=unclassified Rhizobacter TaxID=2640088 RepID=UPI0012FC95D4|nr:MULTISPECIES: DUF6188 family protein [unclassified Rhizobacter]
MKSEKSSDELRLIGQQLCSVLTAIDYITLKFVKYPLSATGDFSDSALIDIEEGFEVAGTDGTVTVRKNEDLGVFQKGAVSFINLIGQVVTSAGFSQKGELELQFGTHATVRLLLSDQGFDSFNLTLKN